MKQTNNAIKFLLAQYRAIFKNAYFKGLVGAVALTASVGVAQAAEDKTEWNAVSGDDVIVSGKATDVTSGTANYRLAVSGKSGDEAINKNSFTITIKGSASGEGNLFSDGEYSATSGAIVIANDDSDSGEATAALKITGATKTTSLTLNSMTVTKGTLTLDGASGASLVTNSFVVGASGTGTGANVSIKDKSSINVSGDALFHKGSAITFAGTSSLTASGDIIINGEGSGSFTTSATGDKATITANGITITSGSIKPVANTTLTINTTEGVSANSGATINVLGTLDITGGLNLNEGAKLQVSGTTTEGGARVDVDSLNVDKATIEVSSGTLIIDQAGAENKELTLSNGTISLKSGANIQFADNLVLTGANITSATDDTISVQKAEMSAGSISTTASKSLTINANEKFNITSGASLNLSGTLAVGAGTLSIEDGVAVSGAGFLKAASGGTLTVGDTVLSTHLATGGVDIAKGGIVNIGTASLGDVFADTATAKKISFDSGSTVESFATLNAKDLTLTHTSLDIGQYNVLHADKLTISGETFGISGGTLSVGNSLNAKAITLSNNKASLQFNGVGGTFTTDISASSGTISVKSGTWVGNGITTTDSGTLVVENNGSLTLDTISAVDNSVTVNGYLKVNGKLEEQVPVATNPGDNGYLGIGLSGSHVKVSGQEAVFEYGKVALEGLTPEGKDTVYANFGQFDLSSGGTLKLDFGQTKYNTLTIDQVQELKKDLTGATIIEDGRLDLGSTNITGITEGEDAIVKNGVSEWDKYKTVQDTILSGIALDELKKATIKGVNGALQGDVGNVELAQGTTSLETKGNTTLYTPNSTTQNFVSTSTGELAGATVGAGTSFRLNGNGHIGDVVLKAGSADTKTTNLVLDGQIDVASVTGANNTKIQVLTDANTTFKGDVTSVTSIENKGTTNFDGIVKATTFANDKSAVFNKDATFTGVFSNNANSVASFKGALDIASLSNKGAISVEGASKVGTLDSFANSSMTAKALDISSDATLAGNLQADTINFSKASAATLKIYGGNVVANEINFKNTSGSVLVGYESTSNEVTDETSVFDGTKSYTGYLQVGALNLNGGVLEVDPNFDQSSALATVGYLGTAQDADKAENVNSVGLASGNIFVGQNSALGLGADSLDELKAVIGDYQVNGQFVKEADKIGAALYIDGTLNIADTASVVVTRDAKKAFNDSTTINKSGSMYLGANTAVFVNGNALSQLADQQALITFNSSDSSSKTIVADGGEIIVTGSVKAQSYNIFDVAGSGSTIKLVDSSEETASDKVAINVSTQNNFLVGQITNNSADKSTTDGTVALKVNKERVNSIMSHASASVQESLIAYAQGYHGDVVDSSTVIGTEVINKNPRFSNGNNGGTDTPSETINLNNYKYDNSFLNNSITKGNGQGAEHIARFGAYAGGVQAAVAASSVNTDAIAARMGMGAMTGSAVFADNGQGTGLWVTPSYKTQDSDGFSGMGTNYGVDVDLYGLALGADYTMGNGIRFGAMFNIGSGDADGNGYASGVSNDFDYYGFSVYGGYSFDKLAIVGDITYSVVDNDVKSSNEIETVSASFDTTALSLGVTAQYSLNINGTDVTPHAGLRYTNIDMDDFKVKGASDIANYDGDKLNLFSIPVGVTFSKDMLFGEWTVKPSFDLTLTANVGDDELDSSVQWIDEVNGGYINNLTTNTTSEVLDGFTYGATAGVAAKNGNLSLGFGVNYTGSSNTDGYGINANARYVF